MRDSLLFVLLKTSEVIVFDATTNPCSARELLVAPSDKQLLSIALVSLSLSFSLSLSLPYHNNMLANCWSTVLCVTEKW